MEGTPCINLKNCTRDPEHTEDAGFPIKDFGNDIEK